MDPGKRQGRQTAEIRKTVLPGSLVKQFFYWVKFMGPKKDLTRKGERGFTLLEFVIASGILLISILGALLVYHNSLVLSQYSLGHTLALQSAQAKLEEMRESNYATLTLDYGAGGVQGNTFTPTGLTGMGVITFDTSNAAAVGVRIDVSWLERGRLFGEDADRDGVLDTGEDLDGDNLLTGAVQIVTYLTQESS